MKKAVKKDKTPKTKIKGLKVGDVLKSAISGTVSNVPIDFDDLWLVTEVEDYHNDGHYFTIEQVDVPIFGKQRLQMDQWDLGYVFGLEQPKIEVVKFRAIGGFSNANSKSSEFATLNEAKSFIKRIGANEGGIDIFVNRQWVSVLDYKAERGFKTEKRRTTLGRDVYKKFA